jgi:hypothetical protein
MVTWKLTRALARCGTNLGEAGLKNFSAVGPKKKKKKNLNVLRTEWVFVYHITNFLDYLVRLAIDELLGGRGLHDGEG